MTRLVPAPILRTTLVRLGLLDFRGGESVQQTALVTPRAQLLTILCTGRKVWLIALEALMLRVAHRCCHPMQQRPESCRPRWKSAMRRQPK